MEFTAATNMQSTLRRAIKKTVDLGIYETVADAKLASKDAAARLSSMPVGALTPDRVDGVTGDTPSQATVNWLTDHFDDTAPIAVYYNKREIDSKPTLLCGNARIYVARLLGRPFIKAIRFDDGVFPRVPADDRDAVPSASAGRAGRAHASDKAPGVRLPRFTAAEDAAITAAVHATPLKNGRRSWAAVLRLVQGVLVPGRSAESVRDRSRKILFA